MSAPTYSCEVAFAAPPGSYESVVMASSPAGYWRFRSGAELVDSSGNGHTLTKTGTVAEVTSLLAVEAATTDKARDFDGSTGYYTVADHATLDLGDTLTLEAWVRADATPGAGAFFQVFDKGTNGYGLRVNQNLEVELVKSGVSIIVTSTDTLTQGSVHHVVATKSGATSKLYLDGVDVTGPVVDATLADTADPLHIGRRAAVADRHFNGVMDELKVYPTALSADLVELHHAAGNPVWTDVSQYMLGFTTFRGRQKELDRIDSGTATVRFNNSDRRFDPTHTGSPYYPNVLPMRKLRLRATHNAVTYDLFKGFVQAWPQTWQGPTVGFSDVSCTDAFLPLSFADVGENETWPRELSGARINRVLDAAGWSTADRVIDEGQSEMAEVTFALGAGVTALDHIREVAGAELGMFFCDGAGRAVFHDRHHRKAAAYLTSQATFGDANTGGIPYQDIGLDTDPARIWGDVQVTVPGGVTQRSQDALSQVQFFRRTMARQVPLANETDAASQAAHLVRRYAQPTNRLSGIRITPTTDTDRADILERELADHVTGKRHPQEVGSVIEQECSIEAIKYDGDPHGGEFNLTATWLVSTPAYTGVDWWILGDATYSDLGVTTKVVY